MAVARSVRDNLVVIAVASVVRATSRVLLRTTEGLSLEYVIIKNPLNAKLNEELKENAVCLLFYS